MSQDKIAFEKWLYSDDCPINPDGLLTEEIGAMFITWQSATAEANKRIAELEREVEKLSFQIKCLVEKLDETRKAYSDEKIEFMKNAQRFVAGDPKLKQQIAQLKASNNNLREALEEVKRNSYQQDVGGGDVGIVTCEALEKAEQALSATPAESLQAFENEVIEKCAKVCDKWIGLEAVAEAIRGLKEVK